jgi:hypothetical protein
MQLKMARKIKPTREMSTDFLNTAVLHTLFNDPQVFSGMSPSAILGLPIMPADTGRELGLEKTGETPRGNAMAGVQFRGPNYALGNGKELDASVEDTAWFGKRVVTHIIDVNLGYNGTILQRWEFPLRAAVSRILNEHGIDAVNFSNTGLVYHSSGEVTPAFDGNQPHVDPTNMLRPGLAPLEQILPWLALVDGGIPDSFLHQAIVHTERLYGGIAGTPVQWLPGEFPRMVSKDEIPEIWKGDMEGYAHFVVPGRFPATSIPMGTELQLKLASDVYEPILRIPRPNRDPARVAPFSLDSCVHLPMLNGAVEAPADLFRNDTFRDGAEQMITHDIMTAVLRQSAGELLHIRPDQLAAVIAYGANALTAHRTAAGNIADITYKRDIRPNPTP